MLLKKQTGKKIKFLSAGFCDFSKKMLIFDLKPTVQTKKSTAQTKTHIF